MPADRKGRFVDTGLGMPSRIRCNFPYFAVSRSSSIMRHSDWGIPVKQSVLIPVERIEKAIYLIRGEKVMLDSDLAALYGVATARINQQVNRNIERFPEDFMFRLTNEEFKALMLQIATSKKGRGGRQKLPLVFTEDGAIMAANVPGQQTGSANERLCRSRLRQAARDRSGVRRACRKDR